MRFGFPAILALALAAAGPVSAQTAAQSPMMKLFTASTDVTALIAKAKADSKGPLTVEPLLALAPYRANLEYRTSVAPSAVHETEAEFFYIIEGSATIVTGGKLTEEKRTNATNLSGAGIEGGTPRKIAKGDFLVVPEKVPHQITPSGGPIVLMSLHVPRGATSP